MAEQKEPASTQVLTEEFAAAHVKRAMTVTLTHSGSDAKTFTRQFQNDVWIYGMKARATSFLAKCEIDIGGARLYDKDYPPLLDGVASAADVAGDARFDRALQFIPAGSSLNIKTTDLSGSANTIYITLIYFESLD